MPTLHEIRRYPVKAMGGESLPYAEIDGRGLVGDRAYAVVDGDGKLATGKHSRRFRRRDEVFEFASRTTPDGVVTSMGGVLAGDDQAAVAEASKDVRARFEQQELSLADLISVDDPDGRQVEEASVAELLKR